MKDNQEYTLHDLPGEEILRYNDSRWQYVSQRFSHTNRNQIYYHVDCDSLVDEKGYCMICGSASPGM